MTHNKKSNRKTQVGAVGFLHFGDQISSLSPSEALLWSMLSTVSHSLLGRQIRRASR